MCIVLLAASGCKKRRTAPTAPPLPVEVVQAVADEMPLRMHFIGTLASNFDAVIQPRVNGYLLSTGYESGAPVRKGQLLFAIDPAQLSTSMLEAQAALESARAQLAEARNNYERAVPLAKIDAISAARIKILKFQAGNFSSLPAYALTSRNGRGRIILSRLKA